MALTVYQNLYALTSQRYLSINQSALGKSIERLSSGLRINHAADDASGLAISEKMRGQISGLKRARMNAQDGISYLQTAEGAMEQASNILQRMRELAVQAANGIYTTNDRVQLQNEVDQLKQELDRISTSVEFNTRKLINGDGTAIWSSDSKYVSALIRSPVAEGNYEITMSVEPGKNEIYKTNIFSLQDGKIAAEIVGFNGTNVGSVYNPISLSPTKESSPLHVTIGNGLFQSASTPAHAVVMTEYKDKISTWTAAPGYFSSGGTVITAADYPGVTANGQTWTISAINTQLNYTRLHNANSNNLPSTLSADVTVGAQTSFNKTGYYSYVITAGKDPSTGNPAGTGGEIALTAGYTVKITFADAETGEILTANVVIPAGTGNFDAMANPSNWSGTDAATMQTIFGSLNFNRPATFTNNVGNGYNGMVQTAVAAGTTSYVISDGVTPLTSPISAVGSDLYVTGSSYYRFTYNVATNTFNKEYGTTGITIDPTGVPGTETFRWIQHGGAITGSVTSTSSGYLELEFLDNKTTDLFGLKFKARFIDAKTGEVSAWEEMTNTSYTTLNINYNTVPTQAQFDFAMGVGTITKGDKMLISVSTAIPSRDTGFVEAGGGTITVSGGNTGFVGPTIVYSAEGSLTKADNGDNFVDKNGVRIYIAEMDDKTGNVNLGNITLEFTEQAPFSAGNIGGQTVTGGFDLAIRGGGEAATTATRLRDLQQFLDGDGNNLFDYKQELVIYGNGKKATVHIEGHDTIASLVEKLNKAIVTDLDMGCEDTQANNNLVRFITMPDDTGWGSIKGTLLIQTALTGDQGKLSFIGDQNLINGLGLARVQTAENNETTVTIRDAHTGNLIGREVTGDDRIYSLIEGIELVLDSRAGVIGKWDSTHNEMVFESDPTLVNRKLHLHLVDNRTNLQVGANKGQDFDVSIPQLDLYGLGLENLTLVSQEHAKNAIGMIDRALTMVVTARATVGAQVSRLEQTVQNLSTAAEYLTQSESRIRDLDVAEESTNFAKNQVLTQSVIAMLAQANQLPQMALSLITGR